MFKKSKPSESTEEANDRLESGILDLGSEFGTFLTKLSCLSFGYCLGGFPGGSEVKESASNAGDLGSIPGSGRSPGEGNGNPLQYSCLENPMDGVAWWATVHGVAKSRTRLSDLTFTFTFNKTE